MKRAGRRPRGPALVAHLPGSPRAKQRLEVILETIAGRATVGEACARLGIKEAMFYRLRTTVLEAGLDCLEPRPVGRPAERPTPEQVRCDDLEQQVEELQAELSIAAVREEIAQILPQVAVADTSVKKTTLQDRRTRQRQLDRLRRRRKSR